MKTRADMLTDGCALVKRFCESSGIVAPKLTVVPRAEWRFGVCAYYRPRSGIMICLDKCALIGTTGQQWSYPGYTVDRTPTGVVCHELGHHVDWILSETRGAYFGDFGAGISARATEAPLTTYAALNDAEWFAEAFRLFVTNPDLLRLVRPRTYFEMVRADLQPGGSILGWDIVLKDAPPRTREAARKKIASVQSVVTRKPMEAMQGELL